MRHHSQVYNLNMRERNFISVKMEYIGCFPIY